MIKSTHDSCVVELNSYYLSENLFFEPVLPCKGLQDLNNTNSEF